MDSDLLLADFTRSVPRRGPEKRACPRRPESAALHSPRQGAKKSVFCLSLCFRTNTHLKWSTIWGDAREAWGKSQSRALHVRVCAKRASFPAPLSRGWGGLVMAFGVLPCPITW